MEAIEETKSSNSNQQVWFITGVTSGVGLALAEKILSLGHKVTGTSRDNKKVSGLTIASNSNFLGIEVDIVDSKSVKAAIEKTIEHFGNITHVVNNAGYGILGAIEEISEEDNRALMDALYFSPLNVINAVLPHFRANKHGYIFNISSVAGFKGYARFGNYSGAKFALAGMTEALHDDVKPFGIKVSCIILGYIATGFQSGMGYSKNLIPEYQTLEVFKPVMDNILNKSTKGDPNKVAGIIYENALKSELPYYLFIGPKDTFTGADQKIKSLIEIVDSQRERNSDVVLEK